MKVTNWRKKIVAAILAGGALAPGACHALNIPLGDPSFDAYVVNPYPAGPSPAGYAYANLYRPTSAWIDDQDNPLSPSLIQRTQDDASSNWLYNTAYGEDGPPFRGTPRTGNQAMHGFGNYSSQEVSTFAAGKYYVFSLWAQGDNDAVTADDSVYLNIFNGSVAFSDANSLKSKQFQGGVDFANRGAGMPASQSKANWTQLSIIHSVYTGDAAVGQPIGVGFYAQKDTAVDDATLVSGDLLRLEVRTTDGQVRIKNPGTESVTLDYYTIKSTHSALNASWSGFQGQNIAGFPPGNGTGNGWERAGGSDATAIGESYPTGNSTLVGTASAGIGAAYIVGGDHDLIFEYGALLSPIQKPKGDYNDNGVVDAADYVVWRENFGLNTNLPNRFNTGAISQIDYTVWRQHFGETSVTPQTILLKGVVSYVTTFSGSFSATPEPTSVVLVGIGMFGVLVGGRFRRNTCYDSNM